MVMKRLIYFLTSITMVISNITDIETQLDAIIHNDPPFGEWYFSREQHFSYLPTEAYDK